MSNMSYCKFQNTSKDLTDCAETLEALLARDSSELSPLSREELSAARDLIQTAMNIVSLVCDDMGHDIDLDVADRRIREALEKANDELREDEECGGEFKHMGR